MSEAGIVAGHGLDDRLCAHCGTSLAGRAKQARMCSQRCRNLASVVRQKADGRIAARSSANAARARAETAARRAGSPKVSCPICGVEFQPAAIGKTGKPRTYCSKPCSSRAFYERRVADGRMAIQRERQGRNKPKPICTGCGKELVYARTESPRCRACGPASKSAVRIRAEARMRRSARGYSTRLTFVAGCCVDCGATWVGKRLSNRCADCYKSQSRRADKLRRHAREAGMKVTKARRRAVFEKDDWICQICLDPVHRTALVPSPLAATVDHVIPLAAGGAHHPDNWQTAHFRCNVRKSDRIGAKVAPLRSAA